MEEEEPPEQGEQDIVTETMFTFRQYEQVCLRLSARVNV